MNPFIFQQKRLRTSRGSTLLTFVIMLPVVVLFVGLAIDLGIAYLAQAQVAKAVDASCLTGMRNYYQGTAQATAVAMAEFAANYGQPLWGAGPVTPTITFGTDANNNRNLTVNATAITKTFFIRMLPQWQTLQVSANAQATRANLIMSIALDRSGSMGIAPPSGSGGGAVLPGAVTDFINDFANGVDTVGMVSFASAVTNNVPIGTNFQTPIINAANAFVYSGATFTLGGLSNAYAQIASVQTPPNENVVKVCVLFTDGYANTSQDSFKVPTATLLQFGGYDSGTDVGFFNATGTQVGDESNPSGYSLGTKYTPTLFYSYFMGKSQSVVRANVTVDAAYRCIQIANAMRANGIFVSCIGLSSAASGVDQTFLQQVANDPAGPGYVPTAYDGIALIATSPAQVGQMFELIASKVLLRLSQ